MTVSFAWLVVPLTDALIALFACVIGANVGSFLNVVVHRLPRRESVVRGGSHCPACGSAIRWRDNVPVLGWLLLRGRCRDCRAAIAVRYPLVEAATAVIVGLVASVELLSGGANLPGERFGGGRWGSDALLLHPDWLLVAPCGLHCTVLVTLTAWSLLERDGQRVPRQWAVVAGALIVVAAVALPGLQPVGTGLDVLQGRWRGLAVSAAGMTAGWFAGRGFQNAAVSQGLVLLGAALGWQAVVSIATLSVVLGGVRRLLDPAAFAADAGRRFATDLLVAAVVHQLAWRWISQIWDWPCGI